MPDAPVATIASWIGELTVPGGRGIPSCAISAVTVAPTHRRRGIARAMLEGELGAALDAGAPIAMLTVSESTLYGRYGFAPRRGQRVVAHRRQARVVDRPSAGRPCRLHREGAPARARRAAARASPADAAGRDRRPRRALGQPRGHPARRQGSRQEPGDPVRRRGGRGARARAVLGARERQGLHQVDGDGVVPARRDPRRVRGALALPPRARPRRRGARARAVGRRAAPVDDLGPACCDRHGEGPPVRPDPRRPGALEARAFGAPGVLALEVADVARHRGRPVGAAGRRGRDGAP